MYLWHWNNGKKRERVQNRKKNHQGYEKTGANVKARTNERNTEHQIRDTDTVSNRTSEKEKNRDRESEREQVE